MAVNDSNALISQLGTINTNSDIQLTLLRNGETINVNINPQLGYKDEFNQVKYERLYFGIGLSIKYESMALGLSLGDDLFVSDTQDTNLNTYMGARLVSIDGKSINTLRELRNYLHANQTNTNYTLSFYDNGATSQSTVANQINNSNDIIVIDDVDQNALLNREGVFGAGVFSNLKRGDVLTGFTVSGLNKSIGELHDFRQELLLATADSTITMTFQRGNPPLSDTVSIQYNKITAPYDFSSPAILLSDVKSVIEQSGDQNELLAVMRTGAIDRPRLVEPTISLEEFISKYLAAIAAVFKNKKVNFDADEVVNRVNLQRAILQIERNSERIQEMTLTNMERVTRYNMIAVGMDAFSANVTVNEDMVSNGTISTSGSGIYHGSGSQWQVGEIRNQLKGLNSDLSINH